MSFWVAIESQDTSKAHYTIEFLNDSTLSEENGEASPLMPDDSLCRIAIETAFAR